MSGLGKPVEPGHKYIDRGDPIGYDYRIGDLVTDGFWQDLDVSPIVPVGAIAVKLVIKITASNIINALSFRKKGNGYSYNVDICGITVVDVPAYFSHIVFCDINRIIEYSASATNWDKIDIVIGGWVI